MPPALKAHLLPGEILLVPMAARTEVDHSSVNGTAPSLLPGWLLCTTHRLVYVTEGDLSPPIAIPLYSIDRGPKVRASARSSSPSSMASADPELLVEVHQKNGALRSLMVLLPSADVAQLVAYLKNYLEPSSKASSPRTDVMRSFAVAHAAALLVAQQTAQDYDVQKEFHRQGLHNPLSHWRVTRLNERYELCPTYPRQLVVPRAITDAELVRAASFRSGRRLPVLCWKDTFGVASICRSSQPLVGVAKARSAEDEALLQHIAETNPFGGSLRIIDCRPKLSADANHIRGKGYEHSGAYTNTRLTFMNIENIHTMRSSLRSFLASLGAAPAAASSASSTVAALSTSSASSLAQQTSSGFLSELDKSGWLEHLRLVLRGGAHIATLVSTQRASVLVHCSDGWDRTPQLTGLAQLLLDPDFRSIDGFRRLLAKEWLSFGHQFALRCGTIAPLDKSHHSPSGDEISPVFLQFVDCVWQLTNQFPTAFEFNSAYLAELLYQVYSCKYGTFLGNSERQRAAMPPMRSLWKRLESPTFVNRCYARSSGVLVPDLSPRALRVWTAYYCRAADHLLDEPLPLLERAAAKMAAENDALKSRVAELERKLGNAPAEAEAACEEGWASEDAGEPDRASAAPPPAPSTVRVEFREPLDAVCTSHAPTIEVMHVPWAGETEGRLRGDTVEVEPHDYLGAVSA